jgi:hypothetical protein
METSDIVVRVGTPEDHKAVHDLAMTMAGENAPAEPNPMKILQAIWNALHKHGGLIGIVGPKDSTDVHGFVLLRIGVPWYSDERVIEECGVYVHPDWRSNRQAAPSGADRAAGRSPGRASMLYRFIKRVADETGYKVIVGVMSYNRQDAKLRYYKRFFGEQAGGFFVYNPRAATAHQQAAE